MNSSPVLFSLCGFFNRFFHFAFILCFAVVIGRSSVMVNFPDDAVLKAGGFLLFLQFGARLI
jgi:hypothetical protein